MCVCVCVCVLLITSDKCQKDSLESCFPFVTMYVVPASCSPCWQQTASVYMAGDGALHQARPIKLHSVFLHVAQTQSPLQVNNLLLFWRTSDNEV